jgi:AcrR family transcriptional regulator
MPLPRFARLSAEKQRHLLAAAAEEFAANGHSGASYNRIIAAAGVSKGAMYYYFSDKEDLYATVLVRSCAPVAEIAGSLRPVTDPAAFWEQLTGITQRILAVLLSDPQAAGLARGFYEQFGSNMPREGPLGELIGAILGWLESVVRQGQAVGAVRVDLPVSLLVRALFGLGVALDQWFLEHWESSDEAVLLGHALSCLEMVRGMLVPPV